jgi:hypothetical protein
VALFAFLEINGDIPWNLLVFPNTLTAGYYAPILLLVINLAIIIAVSAVVFYVIKRVAMR